MVIGLLCYHSKHLSIGKKRLCDRRYCNAVHLGCRDDPDPISFLHWHHLVNQCVGFASMESLLWLYFSTVQATSLRALYAEQQHDRNFSRQGHRHIWVL